MEFDKKVVLLTGASSGIGEECALKFAKAGALLSITARNEENLNRVARQCTKFNGKKPLVIVADLNIDDDVEKIIKNTLTHYGKIDVLVNNAAVLRMAGVMDDVSNLDQIMATNVRGTFILTQKALPHLIDSKGNIVTVSSLVSTITVPTLVPYSMSKAALDVFTRCLALELGPKGVRVNSVNPGPVYSNLYVNAGMSEEDYKKSFETMLHFIPLGKIVEAEEVANLVTFLASDKASAITGSFCNIDGGMQLGCMKFGKKA